MRNGKHRARSELDSCTHRHDLQTAKNRHDLAEDRDFLWREGHGRQPRVGRHQNDGAAATLVGLYGRFATRDSGHDDVAVGCRGLLTHDHEVAIQNAGVDHGITADPQHEEFTLTGEVGGDRHDLFDVFLR